MGGKLSAPHKLTFENPDGPARIAITENVIERLQSGLEQQGSMPDKSTAPASVTDRPPSNAGKFQSDNTGSAVYVTSHQIRKQIENEITENNVYWENRLKKLRDGYRRLNADLEDEYNKAVTEVNQSIGIETTGKSDPKSCKQSQSTVVECYKTNRHQPLMCADEVLKFNECVTHNMNATLKVN